MLRRVEQFVASEAKRVHSDRLQLMEAHIAADLSAKVTKLIKDLIARWQGFSVSEAKRVAQRGIAVVGGTHRD